MSAATMLEDEISWLDNFEPSWTSEMETSEADNILLAGHLRLIKTLLSLCGSEKEHLGERAQPSARCQSQVSGGETIKAGFRRCDSLPPGPSLIQQLLDDFLFRASRIIINSSNPTPSPAPSHDFHPKYDFLSSAFRRETGVEMKSNGQANSLSWAVTPIRCSTASSRLAAYEVLVMLADSSLSNLRLITKELLSMHHQPDPSLCKEFDVRPLGFLFFFCRHL